MTRAVLLCGHGSRDPEASEETARAAALLGARLPGWRVDHGFLEYAAPAIAARLEALAEDGAREIVALPAMLFEAGHVTRDIPALLDAFSRRHAGVRVLRARGLAGEDALLDAAQARLAEVVGADGRKDALLLAVGRGTADAAANATVGAAAAALASRLGFARAAAAFAGMAEPGVERALDEAARHHARVVVLPWFLTTGVLVKRLAEQVNAAAARHVRTAFAAAAHLGPHPRVIDALAARVHTAAGRDDPAARRAS